MWFGIIDIIAFVVIIVGVIIEHRNAVVEEKKYQGKHSNGASF
ncbi:hypothetical protein [Limosilactobacillus antri]|uniref:Uncharacterized protein n=1 Tax=Limosilactobacillus antri DSM 16041 TaxID=525309 RepID=C8P778_9LACO|nr:hypothetical protein [Limosilactobacillus antri]EEW53657.1 hypothetical protein HMPREF0494_1172 [Limosilactobacillus antri DSM 16041]